MSWDFAKQSRPIARKEYECGAAEWLINTGVELEPEDQLIFDKAREEGFKILPGTQYDKIKGLWEGEWDTFRARQDVNQLCIKYEIYPE